MTAFVRTPVPLVNDGRLSLQARAVYAVLAHLVWQAGKKLGDEVELPPLDVIAARCGTSIPTLRSYLKELRETQWVTVTRASRRRPQVYVISPSSVKESCSLGGASVKENDPLLAGARVIGSGSVVGEGFEVQEQNNAGEHSEPPPIVLDGRRNVPLDTLCEVGGIDPKSPRLVQVIVALNGRLHKTTGKLIEPGIRQLFWIECVRWAEEHDAMDRLDLAYEDPVAWTESLVRRIHHKAELYAAAYPGAALTPKALRDHWLDVERTTQRRGGGLSPAEMERFT